MNKGISSINKNKQKKQYFHGIRSDLKPGELINPSHHLHTGKNSKIKEYVYLTDNLDAAIWASEIADGEEQGRVYLVEPIGNIEDVSNLTDQKLS